MKLKTNTVSFKSLYYFPSLENLSERDQKKLDLSLKIIPKVYPNEDVFVGADDENQLTIQVQKRNPLHALLCDEEILEKMHVTNEELETLVNFASAYKYNHDENWGIKPQVVQELTGNVSKMSPVQILDNIKTAVNKFKEEYGEKPN